MDSSQKKVAIVTGATGLVGQKLCLKLLAENVRLIIVGRKDRQTFREDFTLPCDYYSWEQLDSLNEKIDVVFHLAGENIAAGRWTKNKKSKILKSRTESSQRLLDFFTKKNMWPKSFISASAIGLYGDRDSEIVNEDTPPGRKFLSEVCKKWEESVAPIAEHSRLVKLRIGVVLSCEGGFLEKMDTIFSNGVGGKIGHGDQWMSWIHIDDLIKMFIYCWQNENLSGPFNAVAPQPITNAEWTRTFASQLKVSAVFSTPKFALRAILGEMAQIALDSQNVSSAKIQASGFNFQYPSLQEALDHLYAWRRKTTEKIYIARQWVGKERGEVFPFFSDAKNLEKITPPWLGFRVLRQSTEVIQQGTLIDYRIKVCGAPLLWRTEIQSWNPPHQFVDDQLRGPYHRWHHTHSFEQLSEGTLMQDQVIYELPLGWLGQLVAGSWVRKDVQKIFSYRKKIIQQLSQFI